MQGRTNHIIYYSRNGNPQNCRIQGRLLGFRAMISAKIMCYSKQIINLKTIDCRDQFGLFEWEPAAKLISTLLDNEGALDLTWAFDVIVNLTGMWTVEGLTRQVASSHVLLTVLYCGAWLWQVWLTEKFLCLRSQTDVDWLRSPPASNAAGHSPRRVKRSTWCRTPSQRNLNNAQSTPWNHRQHLNSINSPYIEFTPKQ
jgi:hypothetical protein